MALAAANCAANAGGAYATAALDWREPTSVARVAAQDGGWDMVLAADVLYSAGEISPLVLAASALLGRGEGGGGEGGGRARRFVLACSAWFADLQPSLVASAEAAGLRLRDHEHGASLPTPLPTALQLEGEQPVVLEFVCDG